MKKTLEQIIENEKQHRQEEGPFGITACKKSILFDITFEHATLFGLLEAFYQRANHDKFFNKAMLLACWEMINEQ